MQSDLFTLVPCATLLRRFIGIASGPHINKWIKRKDVEAC